MERLEGTFCALWTPTNLKGEILWDDLEKHLEFVLRSGVDGIMALGSTGEFIHLTLTQRMQLLERVIRSCQNLGNFRVIANVSDVQFRNVVALTSHAKNAGATCASVLPPWFFPLEQRDLAEFFIEVSRATDMPLALYNYPEVTGKKIEVQTIDVVARTVPVIAVKQSGRDFAYHHDLLRCAQNLGFDVLTGADTRLEEALRLGCSGVISGLANVRPDLFRDIFQNFRQGKPSPSETVLVASLGEAIAPLPFPFNVKAAVAACGFETGDSKIPLSEETRKVYDGVVEELSRKFADTTSNLHFAYSGAR